MLVVDDEEDLQGLVGWVFRDLGYDVALAGDGGEALRQLEARRPDLVLLDIIMPGMSGWKVLEALRRRGAPPPVVLLTVCGDAGTVHRAVREGVAACVFKPFPIEELVATCDRVLQGGSRSAAGLPQERRRVPRRALALPLKAFSGERESPGPLVDLSPAGAQMDLKAPLEPGDPVRVAFQIPDGEFPLKPMGCVLWRDAALHGFAHGIRFVDLPAEEARYLKELLGGPS